MNNSRRLLGAEAHPLEARVAAQLTRRLSLGIETLPPDISERLRFARERALTRAREVQSRTTTGVTVSAISSRGTALLSGFAPWWQRAASLLPLLVLAAGFMMIEQWSTDEQLQAAVEIDSRLLADDLPPTAYSDPGFAEYLRSAPAP